MEIKKLIDEISEIERRTRQANGLLETHERCQIKLVVCATNDSSIRASADNDFLIEAVKSARKADILRLEKLREAVRVVEKVIDGIVD